MYARADPSVAAPAAKTARLIVRYPAVNDFHPLGKEEMQPVVIKAPFQGKKRHLCAEDVGIRLPFPGKDMYHGDVMDGLLRYMNACRFAVAAGLRHPPVLEILL